MNLVEAELFSGLSDEEITTLLQCLKAVRRSYKKGEVILAEGSVTENIGVVLSGRLIIYGTDAWGNTSVFGSIAPGAVFAEVYACIPGQPLLVTAAAGEDSEILLRSMSAS